VKNKLLILIGGNAGHGKDTLAEMLAAYLDKWATTRTDAYAYTLKLVAHETLGIPWHILNANKEVKESTFVTNWSGEKITVRQALQDIGEWFRNRFGHKIWANMVRQRAQLAPERITVVTDARHPDEELHWMKEVCDEFAWVFTVRVRRESVPIKRGHPSEDKIADEPDSSFDFIIENERDFVWLKFAALELACAVVLLCKTGKKKIKAEGDGWLVVGAAHEPLTQDDCAAFEVGPNAQNLKQITYTHLKGEKIA